MSTAPATYSLNYWAPGEIAARLHEFDANTPHLQAFRTALAYENRGYCVELWEKKDGQKAACCYETQDEN